jgi:hypothetical protein
VGKNKFKVLASLKQAHNEAMLMSCEANEKWYHRLLKESKIKKHFRVSLVARCVKEWLSVRPKELRPVTYPPGTTVPLNSQVDSIAYEVFNRQPATIGRGYVHAAILIAEREAKAQYARQLDAAKEAGDAGEVERVMSTDLGTDDAYLRSYHVLLANMNACTTQDEVDEVLEAYPSKWHQKIGKSSGWSNFKVLKRKKWLKRALMSCNSMEEVEQMLQGVPFKWREDVATYAATLNKKATVVNWPKYQKNIKKSY